MGTNHISGMADHLRDCQLRWTVSVVKLVTIISHQFITLTVDICRHEALHHTGLSAALEICLKCCPQSYLWN